LRSLLAEFYPQALLAFPNLTHRAAAVILHAAPTPQAAQRLTPRRVVALLKQAGRRNDTGLAERISTTLRAPALRQTLTTEHALGVAATGLIDIITAMSSAIDALERELADQFDQHAQAEIITSMPGLGPVLGARVLGELGDDPDRFADVRGVRSFAGTAPSPGHPVAAGWSAHDGSATAVSATPATGGPSPHSPNHQALAPTTTAAEPAATPTTRPYATWPTS
jgi:transposase